MAASPYFITAQVVLVAASAALLRVDWSDKSKIPQQPPAKPKALAAPAVRSIPKAIAVPVTAVPSTAPQVGDHGLDPTFGTTQILSGPPETTPFVDDVPAARPATSMAAYNITADTATNFNLDNHTVTFAGRVSLKSKTFELQSTRLVVHMDPQQNSLKKLVATGEVRINIPSEDPTKNFKGTAYEATYDPKDGSIVLTGWPEITGAGRIHRAADRSTRMVLFANNPRMVTQGRANTRIIGTENLDPKGSKAPMAMPVR